MIPFLLAGGTATDYYDHLIGHVQDSHHLFYEKLALPAPLSAHRVMLAAAALLVFGLFAALASRTRGGDPVPRGKFANLLESFVVYIRDEIVHPNLGHAGEKLLPLFVTFFFFILACNLLGMVPGAATATGNIGVTAGLAITAFLVGTIGGMAVQGPIAYWRNLLPHGLPFWLVPLMFVIEVIGLLTKHFALCVRLFANMIAGHIVILAILGLIFLFQSLWVAPFAVALAVAISALELFVAFLQAYVFTLLSSLFVGMALHPEH